MLFCVVVYQRFENCTCQIDIGFMLSCQDKCVKLFYTPRLVTDQVSSLLLPTYIVVKYI